MKTREYWVQEEFVNVCKRVEASVLLGECSRWFEVKSWLRQGCPLSPTL